MNNSLVRRIPVALTLFAGFSLLLGNRVEPHTQGRRDLLCASLLFVVQPDITPHPTERIGLELAGNRPQGVAATNWPQIPDGVPSSSLENRIGISAIRNSSGLAPPLFESV